MSVEDLIGAVPKRVERILWTAAGQEPDLSRGELQLTFEDGRTVHLSPGPDGAALRVEWERWNDDFAEPLSPENREWVARTGKWDVFDVSADAAFSGFLGAPLTEAKATIDEEGTHHAVMETEAVRLTFTVDGDEGWLDVRRA